MSKSTGLLHKSSQVSRIRTSSLMENNFFVSKQIRNYLFRKVLFIESTTFNSNKSGYANTALSHENHDTCTLLKLSRKRSYLKC